MFLSNPIEVLHLAGRRVTHPEIKDPCAYVNAHGNLEVCVSKGHVYPLHGDDLAEQWEIGRMTCATLGDRWTEISPLKLLGLEAVQDCRVVPAEVCAPAITCSTDAEGVARYDMYVQSTCFQADGAILHAVSSDGETYRFDPQPLIAARDVETLGAPLQGLYDASVSDVMIDGTAYEYLTFSGYRSVGSGDIYAMRREKNPNNDAPWGPAHMMLRQEDLAMMRGQPLHNQPGCEDYEWGIEGAKINQIAEDRFLLTGVCFLPTGARGTRQRVFMAGASNPDGPYMPISIPFEPHALGENGHPDVIDQGDRLDLIYQQRLKNPSGDGHWHPCYASVEKQILVDLMDKVLQKDDSPLEIEGFVNRIKPSSRLQRG